MTSPIQIFERRDRRGETCEALLRGLPSWFGIESAIQQYVREVENLACYTAEIEGRVQGFLSLEFHNPFTAEIHVMAVSEASHRKGVGRALVKQAEQEARRRGAEFLMVKTLGPSRSDTSYDRTRQFYLGVGFRPLQELSGVWKSNPCLILVKSVGPACLIRMDRVGLESEALVQEILDSAPKYHLNTEGVAHVPDAARGALTALPPDTSADQKFTFILRVGDRAVGFADLIRGFPDSETAYLGLLLFRDSEQGQGWGRLFYSKIEALAAGEWGCRRIRLSVVESNPVVPFWNKMGFEMTDVAKPHEGLRLTSVKRVMEKRIG